MSNKAISHKIKLLKQSILTLLLCLLLMFSTALPSLACTLLPAERVVCDISEHNGKVDFAQMKRAGAKGVFLRGAYGTKTDQLFLQNAENCEQNGLNYGVYQFVTFHYNTSLSPAKEKAKQQADHLLNVLKGRRVTGYIVLDLEVENGARVRMNPQELTSVVNYWLDYISSKGYKVMLYCSIGMLYTMLDPDRISVPLWIAYYPEDLTSYFSFPNTEWGNKMSAIRNRIYFWQYTCEGDGNLYGCESPNVDLSYAYQPFAIQ